MPLDEERPTAESPPKKVEVALARLILSTSPAMVPVTDRSVYGVVVPMPVSPPAVIRKAVEVALWRVEVETMNTGAVVVPVRARVA